LPTPDLNYDQLVFSGGGTRCFYFGGFMEVVSPAIDLKPERIAGVSGGAMTAAAFIARRGHEALEIMGDAFEEIKENVRLHKIDEKEGMTPHQRVYREVVSQIINKEALEAIADGPVFEVLLSHPPSTHFPTASTFPAMMIYQLELFVRSTPHMTWPARLGLTNTLVDARKAAREGRLIDLICTAAVIPPVFEVCKWDGVQCVDGGMSSKAPIPHEDAKNTLILLSRRFRNLPDDPRRTYVMPSRETPADKIDFTSRDKIEKTWALGARDGRAFLEAAGCDVPHTEADIAIKGGNRP